VLDDDAGVAVGEVAEVLGLGRFQGLRKVGVARQEIDVGPLSLDALDVVEAVRVDYTGDPPATSGGGAPISPASR